MTDLILIPTPTEQKLLSPLLEGSNAMANWSIQLCGFGPVAAAARAAALVSRYKPDRVLLIGIAGSFDPEKHPVGSACRFDQVACHGIGVGSGDRFQPADSLGFEQFSGGDAKPKVTDVIPLMSTFVGDVPCHGQLLTSCAGCADRDEAQSRRRAYPLAVAEDMEGYGVAMACTLAGVPLQIVRGISNGVGDRDRSHWEIEEALRAAADLATKIVPWRWIPTES